MSERWSHSPADRAADLTAAGTARRAAMLDDLVGAMQQVHRARRARRAALAASVLVVAGAAATILTLPRSAPIAALPKPTIAEEPAASPARLDYRLVESDPAVLDRYAVTKGQPVTEMLDDRALLTVLASLDRPTGLIRRDGRVHLTRPVVDPQEG